MKVNNNEYIMINKNNLDNTNEKEYIVLLDYNKYVNQINNSYQQNTLNIDDNIREQFYNDFPRCIFKINNKREKNIDIFIDYFEFILYQNNEELSDFLMLCTQAVMGSPLELLYKTIKKNNIYIGELKSKIKTNLIFNILSNQNELTFQIKKILRLFYINKSGIDETKKIIQITINIPFYSKEKIIIIYKILKNI
tara:strand:+ start:1105 stop:1689 length:585 start_codon:yes stop_codon:yes gene_type:complete